MAKLSFGRKAANNPVIRIFVLDSSKTDGSGLTGLTSGSSGLKINVMRELDAAPTLYSQAGSTIEAVSVIGTYSAPTATKCRFIKIDDTNLPGWYEIQFAQALFGTGDASRFVGGMAFGATNMAPTPFEVQLEAVDSQDAVRMALTALPNAAAGASGGLPTGNASGQVTVGGYASGQAPLQPTTAGRTLDVAATGEAGLDFDNIHDASGAHTLTNITVPAVTTTANLTTNNDKTGYALTSGYDPAKTAAQAGDAMALTTGERTTLTAAIWNALTSGLTTASSIGKLIVDNLNATVGSRSSHSAADVWAVATRLLTAGTNIVLAKGTGVTGFNDLDAAAVTTAATAATPTAAAVTGNVGGNVVGSVGSVVGTVAANLTQILGTAFTEGAAGRIAAAFKQFFNIASPAATMDHGVLVDTATAVTNRVTANADQIEGADATDQIRDAILSDATRFAGADIAAIKGRLPAALTLAGNMKSDVQQWLGVTPEALIGSPGLVQTDVEFWVGHAPITPDVDGLPIVQPLHRYGATVRVVRDEAGATDRYEVVWLRDGEPFTGTVTTPKIQVIKQSDGSDLIAYTTLPASLIGPSYLYEAVGAELQTDGQGYLVYLDATIDGALRRAWVPVGVDTSTNVVDANVTLWRGSAPNVLQGGRVDGYVGAVAAGAIAAASFAVGALDAVWSTAARTLTSGANIVLTKGVGLLGLNDLSSANVTAAVPSAAANADAVWDEALAGHLGVGSTGEALEAAGSAGDPWATALPGAYGAGTAGALVGDNLNATVGSRASQSDATAIKAKTDQLNFTGSDVKATLDGETVTASSVTDKTGYALSAAGVQAIWDKATSALVTAGSIGKLFVDNLNATISSRLAAASYTAPDNSGIAAIKAKTDQFVFTNAGKVDAAVLAAGDFAQVAADKVWSSAARTLTSFGTLAADVWAVATRTLTSGAGIVLTKGTGLLGLNDPSANANADALLDRTDAIETGWTPRRAFRLMASVLAGRTTGGHTTTIHFRDLNDTKDRVVAVTDRDATGSDRTSVTLDGS